nr:nuclear transport factor 2 family protein [uncultured Flavobacterium sp.]
MKTVKIFSAVAAILLFLSCKSNSVSEPKTDNKTAIAQAEKDFEKMVAEKGIAEGFYHFAAENAVIKRERDTLIIGKENIRNYYSNPRYKNASVTWTPDFIEVSEKGDMAYTYGKYIWSTKDTSGNTKTSKGVFHTVWKKQSDGSWKYVWD